MKYNAPFGQTDPNAAYVDGNPSTGTQGSIVPAAGIEFDQREIVQAISSMGLTPTNNDLTQLTQSIGDFWVGSFGGSANVLTGTLPVATPRAGTRVRGIASHSNTSTATFNGAPIVRPDASAMRGGEILSGWRISFVFDGSSWIVMTATGAEFVAVIPQLDYYVSPSGSDTTGDGLTPGTAWKTVEHARLTLQGFATRSPVTIHVAAGTYVISTGAAAAFFTSSTLGQWIIQGDGAGVTLFNATAVGAQGFVTSGDRVTVNDVGVNSYYESFAAISGGRMELNGCNASSSAAGAYALIAAYSSGTVLIYGTMTVSGTLSSWLAANDGGSIEIGYTNVTVVKPAFINFGTTSVSVAVVTPEADGTILFYSSVATFSGSLPTGLRFNCKTGGGITTFGAGSTYIPGTVAGVTNTGTDQHGWYT